MNNWISIEDAIPLPGERVIVWIDAPIRDWVIARVEENEWLIEGSYCQGYQGSITHWMKVDLRSLIPLLSQRRR